MEYSFLPNANLILLSSHLVLLWPSFVGAVVAFDTKYLKVYALEKVSDMLVSSIWMTRGLSSALMSWRAASTFVVYPCFVYGCIAQSLDKAIVTSSLCIFAFCTKYNSFRVCNGTSLNLFAFMAAKCYNTIVNGKWCLSCTYPQLGYKQTD